MGEGRSLKSSWFISAAGVSVVPSRAQYRMRYDLDCRSWNVATELRYCKSLPGSLSSTLDISQFGEIADASEEAVRALFLETNCHQRGCEGVRHPPSNMRGAAYQNLARPARDPQVKGRKCKRRQTRQITAFDWRSGTDVSRAWCVTHQLEYEQRRWQSECASQFRTRTSRNSCTTTIRLVPQTGCMRNSGGPY